jgi:hypothetical protein
MADWYDFFGEFHADRESDSLVGADLLLSPDKPSLLEELESVGGALDAFLISLSLHTRTPLTWQLMRFEIEESAEGALIPHSGARLGRGVQLRSWRLAQPITRTTIAAVVETYPSVRQVRGDPLDNGLARSLGAYRAATSSQTFIDAVAILACASLDALTVTHRSEDVIARVVPRYVPEDVRPHLEALYLLRHWFAHGAKVPEMKDPEVRFRTLDQGLQAVKDALRAAFADPELLAAARSGVKAVKAHLRS